MKLKQLFILIYSTVIILLISLGIVAVLAYQNNIELQKSNLIQNKSISIATELKQSSDDLTRYCQNYVVTGDGIWEKKYWGVLDIRNGKKPRPDGKIIALQDSMRKLGFTEDEFLKLKLAEKNSNDLVHTEKIAFNAMKGLFKDNTGKFTLKMNTDSVFARSIMFDKKYYDDKRTIMIPISDFIKMVDFRTQSRVEKYENKNKSLLGSNIGLVLLISVISIISFFIIKNKIIIQIATLKENETQLKELNDTKDKLFSIVAHDLRSPFNSILGFSELLIENGKNYEFTKSKKFLALINTSAKNTLNLLDNLLNWSKAQTGQLICKPEKIILSSIIQGIIETLHSTAEFKNITLNYNQSDEIEVYADEDMLNTVLRNLISNAIKFTNTLGNVSVVAISEPNQVVITVSDNGVGMNEETRQNLFDITTNITSQGTANEKGSGLGLVLCKEFVEKLGGKIWVESEEGKGSYFKFTLPLDKT